MTTPMAKALASRSSAPRGRGSSWTKSMRRSPREAPEPGCLPRLPRSAAAGRFMRSTPAAIRGSKSISPKTTSVPAPRYCPRSTPLDRGADPTRTGTRLSGASRGEPVAMYERFYNLRERPFSLSPDPDYLYLSRVHREALSHLQYGIEAQVGFIVISGEIGSGKTTLLQAALRGLDCQTSVSRIVNTMLDGRELIEAIMLDFGLDPGDHRSKPVLLHELARFLVEQRTAGRLALLVVDEAQNLTLPALEEIRMLSNLETEKSKLIQIVLVGQPNLRGILARADLEQLRQRVTVTYHLPPIDADETAAYLQHRLQRASLGAPLEFPRDVAMLIHRSSEGIPRKINVIADAILLFGYSEDRQLIDIG